MAVKLKRKGRCFADAANSSASNVFTTDNLLRIYNIFVADHTDPDVKQNAAEQLAIMLATGDQRLLGAFINLDGLNYCIRYLSQTLLNTGEQQQSKSLFLVRIEQETLSRVQIACIASVCSVFYWRRDIRKLYLFDVEFYRLIFKALFITYNLTKSPATTTTNSIYSCQDDLSAVLFILLFNQVSRLEFYYEPTSKPTSMITYDLSENLKRHISAPFSLPDHPVDLEHQERQQWQAYELNYKLATVLKKKFTDSPVSMISIGDIKNVLDRKFRLCWNFHWHGGSLLKLCEDLIYNEALIQSDPETASFSQSLFLKNEDKLLVRYSSPYFILRQLCENLLICTTHQDALNLLHFLQIVLTLVDDAKNNFSLGIDCDSFRHCSSDLEATLEATDLEFYTDRNLSAFFNSATSNWHTALDRFASILPSTKSKCDQILFSTSFQTISKMLSYQTRIDLSSAYKEDSKNSLNLVDSNTTSVDKWLANMVYEASNTLVHMFRHFLLSYESDELRINSFILPLCDFIRVYFERNEETKLAGGGRGPATALLEICIEQIQMCEVEKFRNLNKLAILVNLISSLMRYIYFGM